MSNLERTNRLHDYQTACALLLLRSHRQVEKEARKERAKAAEAAEAAKEVVDEGRDEKMEGTLRQVDSDFMKMVRAQEEEEIKQAHAIKEE